MSRIINKFERIVSELTKGTHLFDYQRVLVERMKEELKALESLDSGRRDNILRIAQKHAAVNFRANQDEISEHTLSTLFQIINHSNTEVSEVAKSGDGDEEQEEDISDAKPDSVVEVAILKNIINPDFPLDSWGDGNKNWILWWEIQQHKLWLLSAKFKEWPIADSNELERPKSVYEQQIADYMSDPEIRMVVKKFIDRSKVKVEDHEEKFFIAGKYKEIHPRHSFITPKNAAREILEDPNCPDTLKSCKEKTAISRIVRVVTLYQEILANNELPAKKKSSKNKPAKNG